MPLRKFRCPGCGHELESFKKEVECGHGEGYDGPLGYTPMEIVLSAPKTKFMETTDEEKGKSQIVGQEKILKARARKHSRDHDTQDLIEMNPRDEAIKNGWIKEDGTKRKAIDDV